MEVPSRILEFYSGIGGMRYSLMKAGIRGEVVEAFDINDRANDVYEHNFGHRPFQGNIQTLTAVDLDKYRAHVWLLSPPCQPYTRQGLKKDSADARAFSFITILELMPQMVQPPMMLFVENVVGFETSNTHKQMIEVLAKIGFITQEYILSPLQFGVPYSRPRYFCLAKRKPLSFLNPSLNNRLHWTPPLILAPHNTALKDWPHHGDERQEVFDPFCEPIRNFLETENHFISTVDGECNNDDTSTNSSAPPEVLEGLNIDSDEIVEDEGCSMDEDKYIVPLNLIERWGKAMDIVYPDSKRCCCFTKSYYRYVKGTGSLLATSEELNSKRPDMLESSPLQDLNLRFFTPREVANLHSFPMDFNFPPHVSLKQRYALLGNSLSVAVVAPLLQYLFMESDMIV